MNEKLMVDRACFERGCMGLPNPHERLIKEDEVVWLVEGGEWVGLTDEEKAQFVVAYYPSNWDRKTAITLMSDYEKYLKEKNT